MRVKLADDLADDGRALAELGVRVQVQVVVHREQDAPLHRLQPVAHVGQRARGDDADRVVQVAALGLVRQRRVAGRDRAAVVATTAAAATCPTPTRRFLLALKVQLSLLGHAVVLSQAKGQGSQLQETQPQQRFFAATRGHGGHGGHGAATPRRTGARPPFAGAWAAVASLGLGLAVMASAWSSQTSLAATARRSRIGPSALVSASARVAARPATRPAPPGFAGRVAEILKRRCVRCHGPNESHADLRLDSFPATRRGGERGPVVIPGDPRGSLLVRKIEHRDRPFMPPRERLPTSERAVLRAWIAAGANP